MPDRIKGFRKIKRRKNSAKMRFAMMEAVFYHLREIRNIRGGRAKRTETRLRIREKRVRFREEGETTENEFFKKTREARSDRDGTIGRRRSRGLTRFENRNDSRLFPLRRKRRRKPTTIKDRKNERKTRGGKIFKKRKRNKIKIRSNRGRARGKARTKFR